MLSRASRPLCSPLAHTKNTTTTNTIQKVIVAGLASISVNLPATCSALSPRQFADGGHVE